MEITTWIYRMLWGMGFFWGGCYCTDLKISPINVSIKIKLILFSFHPPQTTPSPPWKWIELQYRQHNVNKRLLKTHTFWWNKVQSVWNFPKYSLHEMKLFWVQPFLKSTFASWKKINKNFKSFFFLVLKNFSFF